MRISVVVSTFNRVQSLRTTLDALRHQHHADFEVVVVNGPSDDGTAELLAERADAIRVVKCPERRVGVSRNLGVDAAAGEVVAFVDDDAVPEPRWLADLAAAYDSERVGGAGGLVLDETGVLAQYRYAVSDRVGRTDFDARPPFDSANRPGADPFVYLQGTNASYRRSALRAVGGFDEALGNYYDDVDICAQIIDSGLELRPLEGAVVHHHKLPSATRRDPLVPMADRAYFALRSGDHGEAFGALAAHLAEYEAQVRFAGVDVDWAIIRAQEGFAAGVELGLAGERHGRRIAPADPAAFKPYPVHPRGETVCVVAPERPMLGGEVHVLEPVGDEYRVAFEEGVWVHRFPATASPRGAYDRAAARFGPFDRVVGELPPEPADPARFPFDIEREVLRALLRREPEEVVAGLYAALLRRPATPDELAAALPRLVADQNAFVRAVATSDEARRLEHDLAFLERLPPITFAEFRREVTRLWFDDDDEAFAAGVKALLPGTDAEFAGDRAAFVAAMPREASAEDLAWLASLRTEGETLAELASATDSEQLIASAYRLLLAREPDESAGALRLFDRPAIVWVVGMSDEARERGVPAESVERLAHGVADRRLLRLRRR